MSEPGYVAGPHVAVVGGGVAGLSAALALAENPGVGRVTLLEASPRVGGKVAVAEVAGLAVDTGADVVLARRPEALSLLAAAGLDSDVVHPATTDLSVLVEGALRDLPSDTVMGVPTDLTTLARAQILDPVALARLPLDHVLPRTELDDEVSVAAYVGGRLGRQVVDRLVAPLLAGVYAGDVDRLSLRATIPGLYAAATADRSLLAAARAVRAGTGDGPRFAGLVGGLGRLPLEAGGPAACAGRRRAPRCDGPRAVPRAGGWRLVVGSAADPVELEVDAVVLAVPAGPASRLLSQVALGASVHLAEVEYASVATVALAYPTRELADPELAAAGGPGPLPGSGFVVAADEPRRITGAIYCSGKWDWMARAAGNAGLTVTASRWVGGATWTCSSARTPSSPTWRTASAFVLRAGRAAPVAAHVTRWGGALPQYDLGHVGRVVAIRESVGGVPGLAVCGAAYDGTGVAACVASGERAARDVLAGLGQRAG